LLINLEASLFRTSEEEVKGRGKQAKGKVREEVGRLTDNKTEQLKGKIEQAEGKARAEIEKVASPKSDTWDRL
jgi:uncharacterized protein YjbJ (UPF0337 family)